MPSKTARLFSNGSSQAVRLPADFRFDGDEVFVHRDPLTGDVILSRKNTYLLGRVPCRFAAASHPILWRTAR